MKTHHMTPCLLAVSLALAAPAAALAEEPSTADDDVSQIDGQLVPVGEHNEYRYSFPRWNVSSNPLGWLVGIYGASLSYGVTDNVAIRGDVNYVSDVLDEGTGYEVNAGLPIYFRRTYQGLFLEPGLMLRQEDGEFGSREAGPQVLAGWHWRWDSGLNAAVAFGMGRNLAGDDSGSDLFGNGYLRFGYAF